MSSNDNDLEIVERRTNSLTPEELETLKTMVRIHDSAKLMGRILISVAGVISGIATFGFVAWEFINRHVGH